MFVRSATGRTIVSLLILALALTILGDRKPLSAQPAADELPSSVEDRDATATDNARIALPAIDVGDGWMTRVHVQNVGHAPTVAVLDLYATLYGRLCPIKAGQDLMGTRCTDVIAPGTTWTLELTEGMDLDEAKSAVVHSVSPASQDESCGGHGSREPGQPLAVTVTRLRRPADGQPAVSSAYTGIVGFDSARASRYRSFAPWVAADSDQTHVVAIQNMGNECSTFQRFYFRQAYPGRALIEWLDIKPGATVRVDDVMWFEPFVGSAWVRAAEAPPGDDDPIPPQPLAVVVDQWGEGERQLMTYSGVPESYAASTNYAPLIYKDVDGWNTAFQIQNVDRWGRPITATVALLDFDGVPVGTTSQRVEGWDSWRIAVQDNTELPAAWLGALRVHSEAAYAERDVPPRFLSVVSSVGKNGQALSHSSLLPPRQGGVEAALPWLVRSYREPYGPAASTQTSGIALQNLNPNPGFTRFRIDFYGEETMIGFLEDQLGEAEVRLIDLRELDFLPDDFHGSALVRIKDTTQIGYAAIGPIVIETAEGSVSGDLARAYEGVPLTSAVARFDQHYLPLITKGRRP